MINSTFIFWIFSLFHSTVFQCLHWGIHIFIKIFIIDTLTSLCLNSFGFLEVCYNTYNRTTGFWRKFFCIKCSCLCFCELIWMSKIVTFVVFLCLSIQLVFFAGYTYFITLTSIWQAVDQKNSAWFSFLGVYLVLGFRFHWIQK